MKSRRGCLAGEERRDFADPAFGHLVIAEIDAYETKTQQFAGHTDSAATSEWIEHGAWDDCGRSGFGVLTLAGRLPSFACSLPGVVRTSCRESIVAAVVVAGTLPGGLELRFYVLRQRLVLDGALPWRSARCACAPLAGAGAEARIDEPWRERREMGF